MLWIARSAEQIDAPLSTVLVSGGVFPVVGMHPHHLWRSLHGGYRCRSNQMGIC